MNFVLNNSSTDYFFRFFSYINSSELQRKLLPIKISFILISVLFLFLIIFFLLKTSYLRLRYFGTFEKIDKFLDMRRYNIQANRKRWNSIVDKVKSGDKLGVKLGIIEADKLLKKFLAHKFILEGNNFEEQLNNLTSDKLPDITDVKRAHSIAQKLIQSPQSSIQKDEAEKILVIFKKAFQYLESI